MHLKISREEINNNNDKKNTSLKKPGNKCDQPPSDQKFNDDQFMDDLCKASGFAGYFPTSAKDNVNVEDASKFLIEKVIENDRWNNDGLDQTDTIALSEYRNSHMKLNGAGNKCKC